MPRVVAGWLEISNLWLRHVARDLEAWLRRVWLATLSSWRLYIYESCNAADAVAEKPGS